MRDTHTELYVHLVWGTWDRLPLLKPTLRTAVYACIQRECVERNAEVIALGGMEDHIHLLVRIPPTLAVASLMKQVKGSSSHLVTHTLLPGEFFKWQGAYGALTVSPSELPLIRNYVRNQEEHHREGSLIRDHEFESNAVKSAKADFVPLQARIHSPEPSMGSPEADIP